MFFDVVDGAEPKTGVVPKEARTKRPLVTAPFAVPGVLAAHAEADTEDDVSPAEDSWVQCSKDPCQKWRKLPQGTDVSSLPETWTCEMNTDMTRNYCSAEEEVEAAAQEDEATQIPEEEYQKRPGGKAKKAVECYSRDADDDVMYSAGPLANYESVTAAAKATGIPKAQISHACNPKDLEAHAQGLFWRYREDPLDATIIRTKDQVIAQNKRNGGEPIFEKYQKRWDNAKKAVACYSRDADDNAMYSSGPLANYESITAAAKATGIRPESIGAACLHNYNNHAQGLVWRHIGDEHLDSALVLTYAQLISKNTKKGGQPILDSYAAKKSSSASGGAASSKKPVECFPINVDGKVLQEDGSLANFDSISAAALATGISKEKISECCAGKIEHAGCLAWRFSSSSSIDMSKILIKKDLLLENKRRGGQYMKGTREAERVWSDVYQSMVHPGEIKIFEQMLEDTKHEREECARWAAVGKLKRGV